MENNNNSGNQVFGNSGNVTIHSHSTVITPAQAEIKSQDTTPDETWKKDAYNMLAKDQLKEVLALTLKSSSQGESIKNLVIQIMGRLSRVELEVMAGTSSKQEETLELNQIRSAIVQLITNA